MTIKQKVAGVLLVLLVPFVIAFYVYGAYVVLFSPVNTQGGNDLSPLGIESNIAP